jgi:hypothetical protein
MSYGVGAREPHVGAKRAKHRAKRSPECGDPVGTMLKTKKKVKKMYFL